VRCKSFELAAIPEGEITIRIKIKREAEWGRLEERPLRSGLNSSKLCRYPPGSEKPLETVGWLLRRTPHLVKTR